MLCGIDPHRYLTETVRGSIEDTVIVRAATRAQTLRQQELDYLANEIARRQNGGR